MGQATDQAGNIWETDANGNPVRYIGKAGAQGGQAIAPNQLKVQGAQSDIRHTDASTTATLAGMENDRARMLLERQRLIADLAAKGLDPNGNPIPGWHPQSEKPPVSEQGTIDATTRKSALQQWQGAGMISNIANELDQKYRAGPGSTKGLSGIADYFPTPENQRFNKAADAARGNVVQALGLIGSAVNSPGEAKLWTSPYIPSASDYDTTIEDSIQRLRAQRDNARDTAIKTLGGVPDRNGNIHPLGTPEGDRLLAEFNAQAPGAQQDHNAPPIIGVGGSAGGGIPGGPAGGPVGPNGGNPSPWNQDSGVGLKGSTGAIFAPAQRQEYDHEAAALMDGMVRSGMSGDQINQELAKRGMSAYSVNPADIANMQGYLKANPNYKGSTVNPPLKTVSNTPYERLSGGAPAAAAGGFANAASFSIPEALDPTGFAAWRGSDYTRVAEPLGEIGGAILATNKMGKYAGKAAEALAPSILEKTALKNALRQTATDATYGAARGGIVDGDPVGGAGAATLGSVLGQGVGSAIGRSVSGVTSSPTIARLRAAGVTPTIGHIFRGRANDTGGKSLVAGIEDLLANNSFATPGIAARRADALGQANNAAFNTVSGGVPINGYGEGALDQLAGVKTDAYAKALDPVTLQPDTRFAQQLGTAADNGAAWDKARGRGDFQTIIDKQVRPIVDNGTNVIRGRQAQDVMRLLQSQGRAYKKAANGINPDPAAQGVSDALNEANNAFIGLTARQAPGAIAALKKANAINRGLSVLDDAAVRGVNEGGMFTGAQLGQAIKANTGALEGKGLRKMAQSPLYQLQQDMQAVLPNKVPPTGVNNIAPYVTGATAAAGAGLMAGGDATDNPWLTIPGAIALAGSGLYTKAGTKAVAKALLDRSEKARALGQIIRSKKGVLGSAAAAPFIEYMPGN